MTGLRHILILLMSVLIGLTPVAALEMPGLGGSQTIVICTGETTKTITLDQNGDPVSPHHRCFECCLSVALPGPTPDLARLFVVFAQLNTVEIRALPRLQRPLLSPPATGPPALI